MHLAPFFFKDLQFDAHGVSFFVTPLQPGLKSFDVKFVFADLFDHIIRVLVQTELSVGDLLTTAFSLVDDTVLLCH